jgi:hypothetical protein
MIRWLIADDQGVDNTKELPEVHFSLGRRWWLTYVVAVCVLFGALGLLLLGEMGLPLRVIYWSSLASVACDFLYVCMFDLRCSQSRCQVSSLVRTYSIEPKSISRMKKQFRGPVLFGMRSYRVWYSDATRGTGRFTLIALTDPRPALRALSGVD